ncbi:MAG: DNA-protecting protein DprA [Alphaproteobacteria bacterium]|nr:DNA-protecting protein DprA [Alphaproteobacteria bacterium]
MPPSAAPHGTDLVDRLRLIRSENVGPITFFQLVKRYGTAGRALEALPELARRGGRNGALRIASADEVERELDGARRIGAKALEWDAPDYPALLKRIDNPPPVVFLRGNPAVLARNAVAVVGARNASASGQRFARQIAGELAQANLLVVSGLARGIDGAAHQGALEAGATAGGTLAVLAGGIDHIYPPEHQGLHERILASGAGAVLAEQPLGWVAQARDFPRRNRLIAGTSLGVVVVEAAIRSGSLITARLAGEQGREVFAVPGSPLDPRCRGANDLIRQGATLTESAADVLGALAGPLSGRGSGTMDTAQEPDQKGDFPAPPDDAAIEAARRIVLRALSPTPVEVDEIVRQCQLSAPIVQAALLELELAGRLSRHPGGRVALEQA